MRSLRVVLACVAVGAATWVSRALLDTVPAVAGRMRLALLPSWPVFLAGLLLAALAVLAAGTYLARRAATPPPGQRAVGVSDLVAPAFALLLLLVPYLPVLPDRWPLVQVLAGPFRWVVWAGVAGQLTWLALRLRDLRPAAARAPRRAISSSRRLTQQTALVGLLSLVAFAAAASRLTHTPLFPSGDEPHYLVIAQSLWRDGDLRIENNHARGDYREYFTRDLEPHFLTRGVDGAIYSIHPVGMPILMAPVYAAAGYNGVVAALLLLSAAAAAFAWRWAAQVTRTPGAATLAWAAVCLSAPYLLNTFTVYPEIPAAVTVLAAFLLTAQAVDGPTTPVAPWRLALTGLAIGVLPWLSTKYAPMAAALGAVAIARVWSPAAPQTPDASTAQRVPAAAWIVGPAAVLGLGWFAFFQRIWGSPLPSAPYGALVQTSVWNTVFGVPGLLFDQEYGLLPVAPVLVLAAPGLWHLVRAGGPRRRLAVELLLVLGALLGTVGAFRIWWGGSASPGRPVASGLLLLLLPIAVQVAAVPAASARRAVQHLLVWVSAALGVALVTAQQGLLIANDRDGTSALLEWMAPDLALWRYAPTFIHHEAGTALLHSAAWLLVAAAVAVAVRRAPARTLGGASLLACLALAVGLPVGVAAVSMLPDNPPLPLADPRTRPRLAALDGFDTVTRPLAVAYTPWQVMAARDIVPRLALEVVAGTRRDPQPVRVLHNGRLSLPAGEYVIEVQWTDPLPRAVTGPVSLALQVGRIGPAYQTWTAEPVAGRSWQAAFRLPVDAGFVGLRGSREVEAAIASMGVHPLAVMDAGVRPHIPPVLAAAQYHGDSVFFHDELTYPEAEGFWTMGRRRTTVSLAAAPGRKAPLRLLVHSGQRPNQVVLARGGWSRTLDLVPREEVVVDLPPADAPVVALDITTRGGFVPFDLDPAVRDKRLLGAWVRILPPEEP